MTLNFNKVIATSIWMHFLHSFSVYKLLLKLIDDCEILLIQVADFGLAKLSNDNYTHVSTRIMGTFG